MGTKHCVTREKIEEERDEIMDDQCSNLIVFTLLNFVPRYFMIEKKRKENDTTATFN